MVDKKTLNSIDWQLIFTDLLNNWYIDNEIYNKEIKYVIDWYQTWNESIIKKHNKLVKILELKESWVLEEKDFVEELDKLLNIKNKDTNIDTNLEFETNKTVLSEKIKIFFENDYWLKHLSKTDIYKLNPKYVKEDELDNKFNQIFPWSEMLFWFLSITYNIISILFITSLIIQLPNNILYIILKLFLLFLLWWLYLNHKKIMQNIWLQFIERLKTKYQIWKINIWEYLSFYWWYVTFFFFIIITNIILVFYKFSKNEFEIFLLIYFIIFFYIEYWIVNQTNNFKIANVNVLLKWTKYIWSYKWTKNIYFFLKLVIWTIPFIVYYLVK